jgi:hypothetical protein
MVISKILPGNIGDIISNAAPGSYAWCGDLSAAKVAS